VQFDAVANGKADEAFAHFTRNMRENQVFVGERDPEHRAGKNRHDYSFQLNRFFRVHDGRPGEPAPKASGAGSARSNYLPAAGVLTVARRTRTLFARARFVNRECAPGKFLAVERRHGRASFSVVVHGDERKTARFAGHAVHHQRDFADFAVLFEKILKIIFGSLKGEISYI